MKRPAQWAVAASENCLYSNFVLFLTVDSLSSTLFYIRLITTNGRNKNTRTYTLTDCKKSSRGVNTHVSTKNTQDGNKNTTMAEKGFILYTGLRSEFGTDIQALGCPAGNAPTESVEETKRWSTMNATRLESLSKLTDAEIALLDAVRLKPVSERTDAEIALLDKEMKALERHRQETALLDEEMREWARKRQKKKKAETVND